MNDIPLSDAERSSTGFDLARWLIDRGYVTELSTTEMTLTRDLNCWLRENVDVI
jgi:hypothetical protein